MQPTNFIIATVFSCASLLAFAPDTKAPIEASSAIQEPAKVTPGLLVAPDTTAGGREVFDPPAVVSFEVTQAARPQELQPLTELQFAEVQNDLLRKLLAEARATIEERDGTIANLQENIRQLSQPTVRPMPQQSERFTEPQPTQAPKPVQAAAVCVGCAPAQTYQEWRYVPQQKAQNQSRQNRQFRPVQRLLGR